MMSQTPAKTVTSLITFPKQQERNPGLRSRDQKVRLTTNLLKLEISNKDHKFYNYSVSISPQLALDNYTLQSKIHRSIDHDLNQYFTRKIFSGNNLLCSSNNPTPQEKIESVCTVEGIEYTLTLKRVGDFDLSQINDFEGQNQRYKSTLEKITRDILLKNRNTIKFGDDRTIVKLDIKNVYSPSEKNSGKESIYKGFLTSAQISECGLHILCNNVNKHVSELTVYEAMNQIRSENQSLAESEIRKRIEEYFSDHKTVLTIYGSLRTYRIQSIDFEKSPKNTTFKIKEKIKDGDGNVTEREKTITIETYFKNQYNAQIKDTNQPLIIAEPKRRAPKKLPAGNETASNAEENNAIYLVPELVFTTGTNGLNDNKDSRRNIISKTKVGPDKKLEEIGKIYELFNNNNDPKTYKGKDKNCYKSKTSAEVAREWGINLGKNLEIEGRILPQPSLIYQRYSIVKPNNGLFRSGNTFQGVTWDRSNFVYIYDKRDSTDIRPILQNLFAKGRMKGLQVNCEPKELYGVALMNCNSWEEVKRQIDQSEIPKHKSSIKILAAFLSNQLEKHYSKLKEYLLNAYGIRSQMMVTKKLQDQRKAGSILFNVVEQINVKMGGTNFYIDFYKEGILAPKKIYLVCGYETRQVQGGEIDLIMTSSTNMNLYKTITNPKKCRNTKEEKEHAMQQLLSEAMQGLKEGGAPHPPDYIILYRQGGNQFQNKKLAENEVPVFTSHLERLKNSNSQMAKYNPKFIYVCCNLKSDLKFFEIGGGRQGGNFSNPKSGLVVDSSVTQKDKYEFYIQPQFVNQGTATPCHYQVIYQDVDSEHPEDNLKMEQLQKLSFYLSFYYWTWAGAVRVPGALKMATTSTEFFTKHLNNRLNLPKGIFATPDYL